MTYCRLLHEAGLEPISDAIQVQVDAHQAQLPSPLDQLVRLHHQPLEKTSKSMIAARFSGTQRRPPRMKVDVFTVSGVLIHLKS